MTTLILLAGTAAHATDEEPVCRFLLQQIGFAINKARSADDDVGEKARYLERIALMERSALQSAYPSSAAAFDSELARANQALDAARARSDAAYSAINTAITAFVQQCPKQFAATQGSDAQLVILVEKAMSEPEQQSPSK